MARFIVDVTREIHLRFPQRPKKSFPALEPKIFLPVKAKCIMWDISQETFQTLVTPRKIIISPTNSRLIKALDAILPFPSTSGFASHASGKNSDFSTSIKLHEKFIVLPWHLLKLQLLVSNLKCCRRAVVH